MVKVLSFPHALSGNPGDVTTGRYITTSHSCNVIYRSKAPVLQNAMSNGLLKVA
jgi:hypothetical protein